MRLDDGGEGDVAGGGANSVAHHRAERSGQRADGGEHEIDQAAQPERGEHDGGTADVGGQPGQQDRAGERAYGDRGEQQPVPTAGGVQPADGQHHQEGAGRSRRQRRQGPRHGQGAQQPVMPYQVQSLAVLGPDRGGHNWPGSLAGTQSAQQEGAEGEAGRIRRERPPIPRRRGQQPGQRRNEYLAEHRGRPDPAVRGDQLAVLDQCGQQRTSRRVEKHRPSRQAEGDSVYQGNVTMPDRQHGGEHHPGQVRADHDRDPRQPVDQRTSQRGQQQHRDDLGDHHARHAQPRAGQVKDQQRKRGELGDIAALAHRPRGPQPPVSGASQQHWHS
jgi:hypothetical protein